MRGACRRARTPPKATRACFAFSGCRRALAGPCDLVGVMDDDLMATLGMRPPSPALPNARAGGRQAENHSPSRRAWRA